MNRFALGIGWRIALMLLLALLMGYVWWGPYTRVLLVLGAIFMRGQVYVARCTPSLQCPEPEEAT